MANANTASIPDWIDDIPKTWKCIPLKRHFSIGKGLPITKADLIESGIKVISYGQIHAKYNTGVHVDDCLVRFVSPIYLTTNYSSLCSQGDIIVADTSEDREGCGNAVYIDTNEQIFAGYHTIVLHSDNDNKYLAYLFLSDAWRAQLRKRVQGVKLFSITQKILGQCSVLLPPPLEQRAIVDYLDEKCSKIDEIIAEATASIEEYKDLKQAIIYEAVTKGLDINVPMKDSGMEFVDSIPVTWRIIRFFRSNWVRGRLGWKGLKADEYVDTGFPFLSAFNIINNQLSWNDIDHITKARYDESPEIKLSVGDIVLVKDGAGIGKCARIDNLPLGEATVNSSLAVITPTEKVYYKYEYYYFLSPLFQNIIARLKNGMGVPHLTQEAMKTIYIPIPSIEEQKEISEYLDIRMNGLDLLISEKQSLIEDLQAYKKSLIYEVVTGKRRVV